MIWSRFSYLKHGLRVAAAGGALALALLHPVAAQQGGAPPPWLQQSLAGATLAGEGQMRFFGLRIYDARLWVTPGFEARRFFGIWLAPQTSEPALRSALLARSQAATAP